MRLRVLQDLTYAGRLWTAGMLIWAYLPDALDMINRDVAEPFHLEDPSDFTPQDKIDYMLPAFPPVSLNPTSANPDAAGGPGTVFVTITGPGQVNTWTVTRDSGITWILSLAPSTPQATNGLVSYTLDVNTGPERSANLYVNGVTFTITQADGTTPPLKK